MRTTADTLEMPVFRTDHNGKTRLARDIPMPVFYTDNSGRTRLSQTAAQTAPQDGFTAQSGETAPPTVGERIGKTFGSVIKNRAAGFANGQATLYQAGQSGRTSRDQELLEGYRYDLNRAQYDLSVMEEQNRQTPGYWSERDLQSQRYIIEDAQRKVDAVRQATSSGAQEKATQASYQVADNLAASSAKDDERAKEGLNTAGRFAVDLSKGLIELGIDGLTGKAFGNPMPLRALGTFGSNTQEARQAGATFQQQMAYGAGSAGADAAMRTLLNISESYKKIYGEGPLNKMLQEVVDDLSKTARGRMALSAFVEGGKSLVESEIKHLLRRATYDEDARFDTAGAVYNVILSSAMGAITGAFSPRQKAEQEAQEEVVKPQDPDTIETKTETKATSEYDAPLPPIDEELVKELKKSKSKFTRKNMLFIVRDDFGQIVWLETGSKKGGLYHILYGNGEKPGHEDDFKKAFGVTAEQVSSYLYHVISEGKVVSNEPKLRNGRYGYERVYKYQGRYTVLMAIGINGFVVTAYPYSE